MKKFLSLVLALVMTMSLVTISAGAKDFTDDSKLNYKEAVDVISAVKVVDGYADGSFNPQATLTRGAAAKIICNLILGPTTASALVADAAPFSDVPANSTFAGYIAFCAKEGIISGYADGTFKPGNSLTGYAFMKMLLGALGYDKAVEGYDGPNWSINVAKRALNIGLDDGLVADFDGIKPVTREEACLYAFNTLTADMVEYKNKSSIVVGDITVTTSAEASKITNSVTKDYRETDKDTYQQFCEAYFTNLKLKNASGTVDAFGRPSNTWYKKSDKIGTYPKTPDLTYTKSVKGKDIFKDLDMDKNDAYYFDVVVDGKEYTDAVMVNKSSDTKLSSVDTVGTGSQVEVYEDDQVVTVVNTYLMKVFGDYDEKDEELELNVITDGLGTPLTRTPVTSTKLSSDDFAGLDEYKDGDIVVVTFAYDDTTSKYDIKSIAPAESVTATVTEYVDKDTVTAGGEARSYNVTANAQDAGANYQYTVKEEATLYLDANGNVLWAKGVEAEDNYVYIVEFSKHTTSSRGDVSAYAYFLDGTEESITLNKIGGKKLNPATISPLGTSVEDVDGTSRGIGWYRFTEKDTGKYDLTLVTNTLIAKAADNTVTNYASQNTKLGSSVYYGNKATKFIIIDNDDDVLVYEGIKNAPKTTLDASGVAWAVIDSGTRYAKYVFIDVGAAGEVKGGSTSGDKVYVLAADGTYGTDVDGDNYYRYKAIVNGEEKKIKIDGTTDYAFGLYTNVEYNSKGYVVDMDLVTAPVDDDFTATPVGGKFITKYKNNTIVLDSGDNFYLADNCVIYLITDDTTVDTVSASKLAKDYDGGIAARTFTAGSMIHGVKNADDEYTALYVNVQ